MGFLDGDKANDDEIQLDEDTTMYNDNGYIRDVIFSRDMPGQPTNVAKDQFGDPVYRWVYRMHMRDFVRLKFDNTEFENLNGVTEGSRASAKHPWHSYMDLTDTSSTGIGDGIWERNVAPPTFGNSILWGHLLNLGIAP